MYNKTHVSSTTEIPKETMKSLHMHGSRTLHVLGKLINSEGNVWPCQTKVLKASNKLVVVGGILQWVTTHGERWVGENRSGGGVCFFHICFRENIMYIFLLIEEKTVRVRSYFNTKKVRERAKIF